MILNCHGRHLEGEMLPAILQERRWKCIWVCIVCAQGMAQTSSVVVCIPCSVAQLGVDIRHCLRNVSVSEWTGLYQASTFWKVNQDQQKVEYFTEQSLGFISYHKWQEQQEPNYWNIQGLKTQSFLSIVVVHLTASGSSALVNAWA